MGCAFTFVFMGLPVVLLYMQSYKEGKQFTGKGLMVVLLNVIPRPPYCRTHGRHRDPNLPIPQHAAAGRTTGVVLQGVPGK